MMIEIKVTGLDKLRSAFSRFPREIVRAFEQAGRESGEDVILPTEGLKRYPPSTAANRPPTPYYIRGVGTQYKSRNLGNSERYGTQFYVRPVGSEVKIGNRASYAQWLTDEEKQARHMAAIGWRKLADVAREKLAQIVERYELWVTKTLRDLGL